MEESISDISQAQKIEFEKQKLQSAILQLDNDLIMLNEF